MRGSRLGRLGWLALALMLGVGACGDDGAATTTAAPTTTQPTSTTSQPTTTSTPPTTTTEPGNPYGGEVIVGDNWEPPTLNLLAPGGANFSVARISRAWTCGTQELNGDTLELAPDLVVALPTVANGGISVFDSGERADLDGDGTEDIVYHQTVRYRIVEDAVWEDGEPVTGYDYEFTYQTIMNPEYVTDKLGYADIIPESVQAGEKTFEYTLSRPSLEAELLFGVILPKHQMESTDFRTYDDTGWLSCGPFKVEEWQKGEYVRLVRNDNYWKTDPETDQQLPFLDSVVFRFYPDTASLIEAFEAREVDVMGYEMASEPVESVVTAIDQLKTLEPGGALVDVRPGVIWEYLAFQFGANAQERNPGSYNLHLNYRKAVAHAIDRQRIADEILGGYGQPMSSYLEAFRPSWSGAAWDQYAFDLEESQRYLDALCAEPDVDCEAVPPKVVFTTLLNSASRVQLAQLLLDMFAVTDIRYEAELEDSTLFLGDTLDMGNWDLGELAFAGRPSLGELVDLHLFFDPQGPPPDGLNFFRWGTPEVSEAEPAHFNQAAGYSDENTARYAELMDLMRTTVNEAELRDYVAEAESILADQLVIIPLYQRPEFGGVWADEITGYRYNPMHTGNPAQGGDTWNIELWYRADL